MKLDTKELLERLRALEEKDARRRALGAARGRRFRKRHKKQPPTK